ncbi:MULTISPECIES: amidohydrolase family protein [Mycobacteriaceae]|uniref:Amidohydrolase n=1 Tax=Mycolicibacterium parafortuitum TaxID=39692 RepID=A0ACC6MPL9_MYCPF|nr:MULTISPECIES: amidohydrolase family protein [Mycobacteriaceae]MDZ5088967.1 amidohydrolase [Mycolicibacterium parafortuitum]MEC9325042.1 amidohydrolase family protein [Actinomycetota bacterium]GFM21144.1 amidohydrolase [Mycobacterium sp. PO1]GFM26597.1 amidohydrolase [Mycobacterium sp. PO2]
MKEFSDGTSSGDDAAVRVPVIDASVHIFCQSNKDLRTNFLREPFRSRGFPDYEMDWYGAPGGEYADRTTGPDDQYPGSDPDVVAKHLFTDRGVDVAILHPMTRGIMPDRHLGTALAAAHNEMMVTRWLEHPELGQKFRGTLRVNPDDIAGALREIDKYKDHPRVVQLGIPLQSRELYGKPQYWALWEAAVDAGWPVAVHFEVGSGIQMPPTPSGLTRTYEQFVGFTALNYLYHLMNMIAEGVFERMPDLKFVWADGAADLLTPFIWRMDCFGRPHLEQTPWAPRMPSDYLPGHVYFVQGSLDGPGDVDFAGEWAGFTNKDDMVMYGSSYPHWQLNELSVPSSYTAEQRDKLCWRNAAQLYGIQSPAISASAAAQ